MDKFQEDFDAVSEPILENLMEALLEIGTCTRERFMAQLIMNEMLSDTESLTTENKKSLVEMASHMGPDWAQALYRAAVFITKVA